jgi:hypothetical protein
MACANCKCEDTTPSDPEADLKKQVKNLKEEVAAINKFLDFKFHNDLYHGATCGSWCIEQQRIKEEALKLSQMLDALKWRGYTVIPPNVPSDDPLASIVNDVID